MKESERSEFDEQWKGAFEEAEVSPAPSIWSNLDRELSLAEGNEIKKRIVFYQRLAAASILFALMAGSFGVYHWKQNDQQIAQTNSNSNNQSTNRQHKENGLALNKNEEIENNITQESKKEATLIDKRSQVVQRNSQEGNDLGGEPFAINNEVIVLQSDQIKLNEGQERSLSTIEEPKEKFEWRTASLNADLPLLPVHSLNGGPRYVELVRKLPAISSAFMAESKKNDFKHEKLWASVVAAAGTYTDNQGSSSYSVSSAQSNASSLPTGNSYTVGMIGGVRIAKRWVLQSGVQYMNQSAGYTSNISSMTLDKVSTYANNPSALSNSVSSGASYDIMSTNQFLSVPFQAGYLLIDKKFGWQINPGVATDFFMRNTLTDPSGQRQSYTQGSGSDSPYRAVNFAGLMSTEVSYKLGKSYRVSLVPGFKYSFNPILKAQTTGNPFVWDVGFRFRYIFK